MNKIKRETFVITSMVFIVLTVISIAIILTDISDSYSGAMKHLSENGTVITERRAPGEYHLIYVDSNDITTTMESKCLDKLDNKFIVRTAPDTITARKILSER